MATGLKLPQPRGRRFEPPLLRLPRCTYGSMYVCQAASSQLRPSFSAVHGQMLAKIRLGEASRLPTGEKVPQTEANGNAMSLQWANWPRLAGPPVIVVLGISIL